MILMKVRGVDGKLFWTECIPLGFHFLLVSVYVSAPTSLILLSFFHILLAFRRISFSTQIHFFREHLYSRTYLPVRIGTSMS